MLKVLDEIILSILFLRFEIDVHVTKVYKKDIDFQFSF